MPLAATGAAHIAYTTPAEPGAAVTHALTADGYDASEDGTGRDTPLVPLSLAVGRDVSAGVDLAQPVTASHGQPGTVLAASVRRLTPVECERLQGFPDGWTATSHGRPQSDSARYRQLGNAVAVPVAEWIAHHLIASHRPRDRPA